MARASYIYIARVTSETCSEGDCCRTVSTVGFWTVKHEMIAALARAFPDESEIEATRVRDGIVTEPAVNITDEIRAAIAIIRRDAARQPGAPFDEPTFNPDKK